MSQRAAILRMWGQEMEENTMNAVTADVLRHAAITTGAGGREQQFRGRAQLGFAALSALLTASQLALLVLLLGS